MHGATHGRTACAPLVRLLADGSSRAVGVRIWRSPRGRWPADGDWSSPGCAPPPPAGGYGQPGTMRSPHAERLVMGGLIVVGVRLVRELPGRRGGLGGGFVGEGQRLDAVLMARLRRCSIPERVIGLPGRLGNTRAPGLWSIRESKSPSFLAFLSSTTRCLVPCRGRQAARLADQPADIALSHLGSLRRSGDTTAEFPTAHGVRCHRPVPGA